MRSYRFRHMKAVRRIHCGTAAQERHHSRIPHCRHGLNVQTITRSITLISLRFTGLSPIRFAQSISTLSFRATEHRAPPKENAKRVQWK
jgi:hypothetical protein